MKNYLILILLILTFISAGCQIPEKANSENKSKQISNIPYDLENTSNKATLKNKLNEISALTYVDNNELATVQDEKGVIYILKNQGEEITDEIKFEGKGDFEGITRTDKHYFIVRSDGKIYKVDRDKKNPGIKKYKTPLSSKNDIEGIVFHQASKQLWLLCKEEGGLNDDKIKGKKAIYAFDLENKELVKTPKFLIDIKEVNQKIGNSPKTNFKPSGMAINPIDQNLYIVTSIGKLLIVIDQKGVLVDVAKLSNKNFKQPEGITFDQKGNMFISNEGREGKPNILKFNRHD